jgi:hypothetical protein
MDEGSLPFVTGICFNHWDSPYRTRMGRDNGGRPSSKPAPAVLRGQRQPAALVRLEVRERPHAARQARPPLGINPIVALEKQLQSTIGNLVLVNLDTNSAG